MYHWEVPKVLARRLARIRERTGVPVARQLHRAVAEYVGEHDAPAAPRGPHRSSPHEEEANDEPRQSRAVARFDHWW